MTRSATVHPIAVALLVIGLVTPAVADDPVARDGLDEPDDAASAAGYIAGGLELILDDGDAVGGMGEAGNVELTTGYWIVPFAAGEVQVSFGQSVNPGVIADTKVASQQVGAGVGIRLGLPVKLSPILAAHVGYRQVVGKQTAVTCADCNRMEVPMSNLPDSQLYGDVEVGARVDLGRISVTAVVEYDTTLAGTHDSDAQIRAVETAEPERFTAISLNLQAGVRF